jgi:hypothetical protein
MSSHHEPPPEQGVLIGGALVPAQMMSAELVAERVATTLAELGGATTGDSDGSQDTDDDRRSCLRALLRLATVYGAPAVEALTTHGWPVARVEAALAAWPSDTSQQQTSPETAAVAAAASAQRAQPQKKKAASELSSLSAHGGPGTAARLAAWRGANNVPEVPCIDRVESSMYSDSK